MDAIDLFAGWGGFTEGAAQAGVRTLWAGNHHAPAVATHARNHPDTIHECQDLRQADWTTLPKYQLLMASPACFAGDTTVVTARGIIPIREVAVGDLALTHRGRWRRVTATMSRRSNTVRLGMTETTADHRYYSRRQVRPDRFGRRHQTWSLTDPEWTPAADLHGRFVAIPTEVLPELELPEYAARQESAFWYLIGRWLGDGWVRDIAAQEATRHPRTPAQTEQGPCLRCGALAKAHARYPHLFTNYCSKTCSAGAARLRRKVTPRFEVTICTGLHEDSLAPAFEAAGLTCWSKVKRTAIDYTTSSKELVEMLREFGRGAAGKRLPGWALCLPEDCRKQLLSGYLDADGSATINGFKTTTVSKQLAVSMRVLASTLGLTTNVSRTKCASRRTIEGREVNLAPYQYTVGVVDGVPERYTRVLDGLRWMKQRKAPVECGQDVEVFDLTVDEDHSFVADGFVVHNCQGHSPTSQPRRRAYHDAMRATAFAVVDCADVTEPEAIVVENVPAFTRWRLYGLWCEMIRELGYDIDERIVTASKHGVAQRRTRLFLIATRHGVKVRPLREQTQEPAFEPLLQDDVPDSLWVPVAAATPGVQARIAKGRTNHGRRFLTQHVTGHPGTSLREPIRTITTAHSHWNLVDGDYYRPLTSRELARGMGFRDTYTWDETLSIGEVTRGIGNAVCPPVATEIVSAVADAVSDAIAA